MNPDLPEVAVSFGRAAARALAGLGGVDAAREAEADPDRREQVGAVLSALGVDELDPRRDLESAAAAAELCRQAGRVALPYPLPGVLVRGEGGDPFAVVGDPLGPRGRTRARVDHADLFPSWRVATVGGWSGRAEPAGGPLRTKLGPFAGDVVYVADPNGEASGEAAAGGTGGTGGTDGAGGAVAARDVRLHLTLTAWVVLGTVERALELAVEHVTGRVQFGQALSGFQAVQFQLADAAVQATGLAEMARFTLWRLWAEPERALPDALALRLSALDSARAVLRTAQQLHGAAGLCDEYDISILCRHIQPSLRLPFGAERTAEELSAAVAVDGFDSLFPHGAPHADTSRGGVSRAVGRP